MSNGTFDREAARTANRASQCIWEASAYRFDHCILLHAWSVTSGGDAHRYFSEPLLTLDPHVGDEQLGAGVRQVLDASMIDCDHPGNRQELFQRVIEASGHSSSQEFTQANVHCQLLRCQGRLRSPHDAFEITPTRKALDTRISDQIWESVLWDETIHLRLDASDTGLGQGVKRGFDLCAPYVGD